MSEKEASDPIAKEQGRRLRLAREAKSRTLGREFTQQEVADKVGQGLTLAAYGSYERGRHRVPKEWIEPIARVLGVSPGYILGLPEPKPLKDEAKLIADITNQIESPDILRFLVGAATDQLKLDRVLREKRDQPYGEDHEEHPQSQ